MPQASGLLVTGSLAREHALHYGARPDRDHGVSQHGRHPGVPRAPPHGFALQREEIRQRLGIARDAVAVAQVGRALSAEGARRGARGGRACAGFTKRRFICCSSATAPLRRRSSSGATELGLDVTFTGFRRGRGSARVLCGRRRLRPLSRAARRGGRRERGSGVRAAARAHRPGRCSGGPARATARTGARTKRRRRAAGAGARASRRRPRAPCRATAAARSSSSRRGATSAASSAFAAASAAAPDPPLGVHRLEEDLLDPRRLNRSAAVSARTRGRALAHRGGFVRMLGEPAHRRASASGSSGGTTTPPPARSSERADSPAAASIDGPPGRHDSRSSSTARTSANVGCAESGTRSASLAARIGATSVRRHLRRGSWTFCEPRGRGLLDQERLHRALADEREVDVAVQALGRVEHGRQRLRDPERAGEGDEELVRRRRRRRSGVPVASKKSSSVPFGIRAVAVRGRLRIASMCSQNGRVTATTAVGAPVQPHARAAPPTRTPSAGEIWFRLVAAAGQGRARRARTARA